MQPFAGAPSPGWYPDPSDPYALRWWDGGGWTEHRAPAGTYFYGGMSQRNHELEWVLPVNRDGFAIAAGYLGLFSLFPNPFTSIAAIVCGVLALKSIKRTGKLGRGRAIFGIIMGGLSLGVILVVIIAAATHPQ